MKTPLCVLLVLSLSTSVARSAAVARWDFGEEDVSRVVAVGEIQRDVPGPRPPEYPGFERNNTAVRFDGSGAHFALADSGAGSPFDFTNGDAITLEAWVEVDQLRANENIYVIGKGRTGGAGFAADNQNWALRLRAAGGQFGVSFLFATPRDADAKNDAHWHRWTTKRGFGPNSGWHHIAVTYRFGDPTSVRGWIDGQAQPGEWDMGGATTEAPVVDDDAVWIGSSMRGSPAASFRGGMDAVAIHREVLGDVELKARFQRAGGPVIAKATPAVMPELGVLPAGRVVATFHDGMPAHDRWLNEGEKLPAETTRWAGQEFLLPRLPLRYDAWGIRAGWKSPVLARMAADVRLPVGTHRVVLRARGLSRLWMDGTLVASTKPHTGDSGGHDPVKPVPTPPLPGLRPVGFGMQEVVGELTVKSNAPTRFVLETMIGGKRYRPDSGELTVAVSTADGRSFVVLQPEGARSEPVPLTDAAVTASLTRIEASLDAHDDATRRVAATTQDAFWQERHRIARTWAGQQPALSVPVGASPVVATSPSVPAGASHPIDAFLREKIERAVAEAAKTPVAEARNFHDNVLSIPRAECFRCHGDKDKGGLKLNSREAALAGGASKKPAIVPGNPAASELMARIRHADEEDRMPRNGDALTSAQIAVLEKWIANGAVWPAAPLDPDVVALKPVVDDAAFLRRVYFDTVGVPPGEREARAFLADTSPDKRIKVIDRLLADERWADHWVSYWQDVLAENPNMVKPSLNNTGPFRWFLHEALRDGKPMDRLVTELILLRGSEREGGSAGFGFAADNDAPFAAKGHIVATAFLGIELQCARCHDSPYHSTKQRDLYSLAALFERKPVTVPISSTVPAAFFERKARESLIKVTLPPREPVAPVWPFAALTGVADDGSLDALMQNPKDTRERLAALVTAPQNTRFSQVIVNRIWRRLIGAGFVEPAHDWEGHAPSHPELLAWLAREFVARGYDLRQLARLILTSQVYQRAATGKNLKAAPERRFFAAPEPRRLSAEQVVDSLFAVSGQPIYTEELSLDLSAQRGVDTFVSLGAPRRAWMFASLSNERDRPSINLPRAQAVVDVLEAFGWTGSRQNPRTDREDDPNVLQPGVLANSLVSTWATRAAQGSELADLAVGAATPEALVESVFLRFYSRSPTAAEGAPLVRALTPGFATRVLPASEVKPPTVPARLPTVSWSNHLVAEANAIAIEMERRARAGPPADPRLRPAWREVFEDVVWGLVNTREFVWLP